MRRADDARVGLKPFYPVIDDGLLEILEEEERKARNVMFALRAGTALRRQHLRDLAGPLGGWLAALEVLLDMRQSTLAIEIDSPKPRPMEGTVNLRLEKVDADLTDLFFGYDTDEDESPR
jgi:hypothetical protein